MFDEESDAVEESCLSIGVGSGDAFLFANIVYAKKAQTMIVTNIETKMRIIVIFKL